MYIHHYAYILLPVKYNTSLLHIHKTGCIIDYYLFIIYHQFVTYLNLYNNGCTCKIKMFKLYLIDGAEIKLMRTSLHTLIWWEGGISKMCFRKKVLSSDNCHTMRRRDTATTLMVEEWGSSQRTLYQLQNQSIETVLSTIHTLMVPVWRQNIEHFSLQRLCFARKIYWIYQYM